MPDFNINVKVDPAKALKDTKKIEEGLEKVGIAANKTRLLIGAALAVGVAAGVVHQLIKVGKAYEEIEKRVRAFTASQFQQEQVMGNLLQISNVTNTSLAQTADLYQKLAMGGKDLNITHQEALTLTKGLTQAVTLSNASQAEGAAQIGKLAQSLSLGAVSAGQLRTLMLRLPAVTDVLTESLGKTRQELLKMAADGQITTRTFIKAFTEAEQALDEKMGKRAPKVADALSDLKNKWDSFIGQIYKGVPRFDLAAKALQFLADNFNKLILGIATTGDTFVGFVEGLVLGIRAIPSAIRNAFQGKSIWEIITIGSNPLEVIKLGASIGKEVGDAMQTGFEESSLTDYVTALLARMDNAGTGTLGAQILNGAPPPGADLPDPRALLGGGLLAPGTGDLQGPAEKAADNYDYERALGAVNEQLAREHYFMGLSNEEYQVQSQLLQLIDGLRSQGIELLPEEAARYEQLIRENQALQEQEYQYTRLGERLAQVTSLVGDLGSFTETLALDGVGVLSSAFEAALTTSASFFDALRDGANAALAGVASLILQMYLLKGLQAAGLPTLVPVQRAAGGPLNAGQPAVVGEKGPELFVPNSSGNVIPNGAMGGVNLKVVNVSNPRELANEMDSGDRDENFLNMLTRNPGAARAAMGIR